MASIAEAKDLICEMCRMFYTQGWVTGTGGGISIRVHDTVVMAPSGVQKERMRPEDMYQLDAKTFEIRESPRVKPAPHKPPKLSECAPLFQAVSADSPSPLAFPLNSSMQHISAIWKPYRDCTV